MCEAGLILIALGSCCMESSKDAMGVPIALILIGIAACACNLALEIKRTYKSGNFRKFEFEKHL